MYEVYDVTYRTENGQSSAYVAPRTKDGVLELLRRYLTRERTIRDGTLDILAIKDTELLAQREIVIRQR